MHSLQLHPDWPEKYAAQHEGATGDRTTEVAVAAYRKRHPSLLRQSPTQRSYEEQTRLVLFEFISNDPWYFVQLKYQNAEQMINAVSQFVWRVLTSLPWSVLVLAICAAAGLARRIATNSEDFRSLTWCTAAMLALAFVLAVSVWMTVATIYAFADPAIMAATAALLGALWAMAACGLLAVRAAALLRHAPGVRRVVEARTVAEILKA